jgi:hypothetical protein
MNYLWMIRARSRQARQTVREFALDGTQIRTEQQAQQRAEAFAFRMNRDGISGARDWQAVYTYEPVGMATLGT